MCHALRVPRRPTEQTFTRSARLGQGRGEGGGTRGAGLSFSARQRLKHGPGPPAHPTQELVCAVTAIYGQIDDLGSKSV